ncbi:MAG TPA: hypothetical protein VN397_00400 [Candidatus Methylomirabilis sp.]|nr:hypothetical protein [Candidatus Methylomirabilis sp.]
MLIQQLSEDARTVTRIECRGCRLMDGIRCLVNTDWAMSPLPGTTPSYECRVGIAFQTKIRERDLVIFLPYPLDIGSVPKASKISVPLILHPELFDVEPGNRICFALDAILAKDGKLLLWRRANDVILIRFSTPNYWSESCVHLKRLNDYIAPPNDATKAPTTP